MTNPPTKEAREEYVQSGGVRCPVCGNEQIEGGPFECEAGVACQTIHCLACDSAWSDVYRLANIHNSDWPDDPSPRKKGCPKDTTSADRKKLTINLGNVDWKNLRRQKASLLRAISIVDLQIGEKRQEDLNGILHLIDFVQDQAAGLIRESIVFGRNHIKKPPRRQ